MNDKKFWEDVVRKGAISNKPVSLGNGKKLNPHAVRMMNTIAGQLKHNGWHFDPSGIGVGENLKDKKLALIVSCSRDNYGMNVTVLNSKNEVAVSAGPEDAPPPIFDTIIFKTDDEEELKLFSTFMNNMETLADKYDEREKYV
jgi:hypothetical protein